MPAGSCHRTSPPCVGCQPTFPSSTSSPRLQTNNYRLGFLNYRFVVNLYIQNLDKNKNCFIFATKLPTPKQTELSASYMLNTIIFILKYRHIYICSEIVVFYHILRRQKTARQYDSINIYNIISPLTRIRYI